MRAVFKKHTPDLLWSLLCVTLNTHPTYSRGQRTELCLHPLTLLHEVLNEELGRHVYIFVSYLFHIVTENSP
jgi:hypothetical protein